MNSRTSTTPASNRPGLAGLPAPGAASSCFEHRTGSTARRNRQHQPERRERPPFGSPRSLSFTGAVNVVPGEGGVSGATPRPRASRSRASKLKGNALLVTAQDLPEGDRDPQRQRPEAHQQDPRGRDPSARGCAEPRREERQAPPRQDEAQG